MRNELKEMAEGIHIRRERGGRKCEGVVEGSGGRKSYVRKGKEGRVKERLKDMAEEIHTPEQGGKEGKTEGRKEGKGKGEAEGSGGRNS